MEIGDRLDRYVVEGQIGEGGMATVYLARHETLRSLHALKVLRIDVPSIKQRLLTEGRVQASLRHPNVVAVTDVLDKEGVCALVMEYVDGPGLDQWIDDPNRSTDLATALDIFKGIALGVAAAHKAGLVHRDLKPDNVLLASSNAGMVPKVTDFGLVKVSEVGVTKSGVMMGTPEYMSPEQIRDSASVDSRSDLWALGVMLYELLTHRQPFNAEDILEVYNLVAKGEYIPVQAINPQVPDEVAKVVRDLLQLNPEARIQTAEEVVERLFSKNELVSYTPQLGPKQLIPTQDPEADRAQTVPMGDNDALLEITVPMEPIVDPSGAPQLSALSAATLGAAFGLLAFLVVLLVLAVVLRPTSTGQILVEEPDPEPVPVVAQRVLEIRSSEPLSRLVVDGETAEVQGREAVLTLAVGKHELWAEVGECSEQARGCGDACPPGCASVVRTVTVDAGEGSQPLDLVLKPTPPPDPVAVIPTPPPAPAPAKATGRIASATSYAAWVAKHPEWEKDAAKASGRATTRYLRKWKSGPPAGPLTQVPWAAAKDYCASRGGLLGLDDAPLTWEPGITQEWRSHGGRPAWRRYDGVTSTANPGNESFTFTGVRCKK